MPALVAVAIVAGTLAGTTRLSAAEQDMGGSARAEAILARAGFRTPAAESVLVRSATLPATACAFRDAVRDLRATLARLPQVEHLLAFSAVLGWLGLVALLSHVVHASQTTSSVALLTGMAVGVDYSLFYLRREREERARGLGPRCHAAAATSVAQLVSRRRSSAPLGRLYARELEAPALMAEGRSNASIAAALVLTVGAVEKHIASILAKLELPPSGSDHRRVLAVLAYSKGQ